MGKGLKEEGEEEKEEKCAGCFYGMDSTDTDNPLGSPLVCGHLCVMPAGVGEYLREEMH